MPLANYKGYHGIDKPGNVFYVFDDDNCRGPISVPDINFGIVIVLFVEPWYWRESEIFSLVA